MEKLVIGLMSIPEGEKAAGIGLIKVLINGHFKDKSIHNIYILFLSDKKH